MTTRFILVLQDEKRCYHLDYGTSETEAVAKAEAYVHLLRQEFYTAIRWPGAPVWDVARSLDGQSERFTVALYEKCDDGEDGGATDPFGCDAADSLELPVDHTGVRIWWN